MIEKEFVLRTAVVCDEDNRHCYCIEREFVGMEGRTAILLTLYPSYSASNSFRIDDTAKAVLGHMEELGINKMVTVNLFSRIVSGAKMSYRDLKVDERNMEFIQELFAKPEYEGVDAIVAFGNSMRSNKAAIESKRRVLSILRQGKRRLFQFACDAVETQNANSLHPLFLGVRAQNLPWRLESYADTEFQEQEDVLEKKKAKKKA